MIKKLIRISSEFISKLFKLFFLYVLLMEFKELSDEE